MNLFPVILKLFALVSAVSSQSSQGCQTADGNQGECVSISECPPLLSLLQSVQANSAQPGALALLRRAICSFVGSTPFVCCPSSSPAPEEPNPQPNQRFPRECGTRGLGDRVISGEDAPLLAWPWMALLESVGSNGRLSLVCGGVLISERYVLTAAHCVDPDSGFTLRSVRLGEHTISTNPDCRDGVCTDPFQSVAVEQTIIHENYGNPFGCRNCNDIALIRMARPVQFNQLSIRPICLPQNLERDLGIRQNDFNGEAGWVAGWGTTDPQKIRPADVLQQVLLSVNESLCRIDLRPFPDSRMALCAGGQQQDTCRGDSGGPMVMGNEGDTRYFLVGIVSRGPIICGAANTGGLYTNINFYMSWILDNLK